LENLYFENKRLDETTRQFNITDTREKQQFSDILKKDYDTLNMQEKQYMLNYGLDRDKFNETKSQFSQSFGLEQQKMAEAARQFNITDARDASQFSLLLKKDYDTLSVQEKQFLMNYGLDRDKFDETKNQFSLTYQLEEKKLSETARQFNITDEREASQFGQLLKKDYDQMSQEEKQFLMNYGLGRDQFEQTKKEFDQSMNLEYVKLASQERIAQSQLNLDQAKLTETARQFNVSTQQANEQFNQNLKFNYDSLSQGQQQFMESLGFDKEKFTQAKKEFELNYELSKQIQTKDLDLREQALAQDASQFSTKLEFDKWATQAGLDDKAADRVWQATQNDKALTANRSIAEMQNNTERWKQVRSEELTKLGWDKQSIESALDRQQTLTITEMNNSLTREVESGRISMQEAQLVEQTRQFNTSQEWIERAKAMDIDENTAQRLWATGERVASEAFKRYEMTFEAQVEKEIASGTWVDANGNTVNSMQAKQLIEQARQFDTAQEWAEEAAKKGFSNWDAMRAYEKAEVIEERQWEMQVQQVQNELTKQGWNFQAAFASLESLPPEQARTLLNSYAASAGIKYTVKGSDGKPLVDSQGNPVTAYGLEDVTKQLSTEAVSFLESAFRNVSQMTSATAKDMGVTSGKIKAYFSASKVAPDIAEKISGGWDVLKSQYSDAFVDGNDLEGADTVAWTTKTDLPRWALTSQTINFIANNKGKLYKAKNGKVYQIVGTTTERKKNTTEKIVLKDITTGQTVYYSQSGGRSAKYNFTA
jgi:hypothetical protein